MINLVLVDENDNEIGVMEKVQAHLGDGTLHRAFTAIVFNKKGETLVAQRSKDKMLWPLFWDNTCASHPLPGEGIVESGERRLSEELGFTCPLKKVDMFQYQLKYLNVGAENELCATLVGEYNGEVKPVESEVADYRWISLVDLKKDMKANPEKYTIWFKIALDRLIEKKIIEL